MELQLPENNQKDTRLATYPICPWPRKLGADCSPQDRLFVKTHPHLRHMVEKLLGQDCRLYKGRSTQSSRTGGHVRTNGAR
jgi:hypothetical protein